MARLICLFGGTFDPVHYGHLRPLDELQQVLAADVVHIIPASIPPHRSTPRASSRQRVDMLELALREYPGFVLDTRELEQEGPSWTVLSLQSLRQQYPDESLCLVMGSDAFAGLPSWYHWQEIWGLAHIIVIERAGFERPDRPEWAAGHLVEGVSSLRSSTCGGILYVSLKGVDISATDIRLRLSTGQDVTALLNAEVIAYIQQNSLYRELN
jgi:nicotinate-nucleotide adenylyltransferase